MKNPQPAINIASDGHVHTRMCRHATGDMEEYVLAGISKGLQEIVFLEHLEIGVNYLERTWLSEEDFDFYFREGERLRGTYAGRIAIGTGVELGYNPRHVPELLDRLAARPWDRVGISCHFLPIGDSGHHLNLLSRQQSNITLARQIGVERLLTEYFRNLIEAVQKLPGTVLCHLDAALRYVPERQITAGHMRQIEELLTAVKARNMALEVNTSGITIRQEPFPAKHLLAMALHCDIPLVAGSDAHRPEDVGRFFAALPDYITSAACQ